MPIYGPSKPSSQPLIEGEKLGMDQWIGQPSCCGLGWDPLFSRAVALSITADDFVKGCYTWTA
jgi:hypothetical protein